MVSRVVALGSMEVYKGLFYNETLTVSQRDQRRIWRDALNSIKEYHGSRKDDDDFKREDLEDEWTFEKQNHIDDLDRQRIRLNELGDFDGMMEI